MHSLRPLRVVAVVNSRQRCLLAVPIAKASCCERCALPSACLIAPKAAAARYALPTTQDTHHTCAIASAPAPAAVLCTEACCSS